jgi:hypothetical protein
VVSDLSLAFGMRRIVWDDNVGKGNMRLFEKTMRKHSIYTNN